MFRVLTLLWRRLGSPPLMMSMSIVVISVAMIWAFTRFGTALETSLTRGSGQLLGADLVLEARNADDLAKVLGVDFGSQNNIKIGEESLDISWGVEFITTTLHESTRCEVGQPDDACDVKQHWSTVSVRAIDNRYPIYDPIELETGLAKSPGPNETWVDKRILTELRMRYSETLKIGQSEFTVTGVILREPDRLSSGFRGLSSRVIVRLEDVESMGILAPGSLATYRVSVRASDEALDQVEFAALKHSVKSIRPGQVTIGSTALIALRFFPMVSTFVLLIGTVTLIMVARRFARQEQRVVSLMRMLGASRNYVRTTYLAQLIAFFTLAMGLGLLLGNGLELFIENLASDLISVEHITSTGAGTTIFLIALTTLFVLPWPYLASILQSEPVRLLRNSNEEHVSKNHIIIWSVTLVIYLSGVVLLITDMWTAVAIICMILFSLLIGFGFVRFVKWIESIDLGGAGPVSLAMKSIRTRSRESALLIAILAVMLTVGQTVSVIGATFVRDWQAVLPENLPNWFAMNIQEWEINNVENILEQHGADINPFLPRAGGKLLALQRFDGSQVDLRKTTGARDINYSWSNDLPAYNEVVEGRWWNVHEENGALVSISENIAMRYDLNINDKLIFEFDEGLKALTIASIRKVNWTAISPNFQIMVHPSVARDNSGTYLTSFSLPPGQDEAFFTLIDQFDGISFISVGAVAQQAAEYVQLLVSGVRTILLMLTPSAILLMTAAIWASMTERHQLIALMRVMGANRTLCVKTQLYEFMILGMLAGLASLVVVEIALAMIRNLGGEFGQIAGQAGWVFYAPVTGALMGVGVLPTVISVSRTPPSEIFRGSRYSV